ncbi:MAG: histidine phosphatase family protein [Thermodesulfobacteriota bacterium]
MAGTIFLLIRHGAVDTVDILGGRSPGIHLSPTGRRQAEALPERLAGLNIDAIYASPLERTRETAEPLAAKHGLEIQIFEDALEFDIGGWTGKTFAELEDDPLWRRFNRFRSETPAPDGESMAEVQARFAKGLHRLQQEHPGRMVAVFSHQDVIRAALCLYLGMPLDLFSRLAVDHASVSMVSVHDAGAEIIRINDTEHWRYSQDGG